MSAPRRAGWLRRATAVVGATLVLASVPAGTSAQDAGDADLVGYQGSASGTSFTAFPTLPALLPVEAPFEATLGLASATLSSGGQGFGRASTFFPGTLTAGLRPLIETASGARLPIPDYPVVVEAREFEAAKQSEIPGVTMAVDVDPARAIAVADVGSLGVPAVIGVQAMRTESRVELAGAQITARSTTTLQGIDIAGALTIGSLVSESFVTSDGTKATCGGGLTISGAAVGGTPVRIDDAGVHAQGQDVVPGVGLGRTLEQVLRSAGLVVRALGGDDACTTASGSRTTAGLLIGLPLPAIGAVPAGDGLRVLLGSTSASAGASSLPPEEPLVADQPPVLGDVVARLPGPLGGGAVLPPVSPPRTGGGDGGGSDDLGLTTEPTSYGFGGVPVSLMVGLALLAIVASSRVRRYLDRIIGLLGPP